MIKTAADIINGFKNFDKPAIVYKTGFRTFSLTYRQLYTNVLKTYSLLEKLKVKRRDKILIWGYNCPEWGTVFLASILKGVVVVPIDYMATHDFVQKIQSSVKAKVIFHSEYKLPRQLRIKKIVLEYLDAFTQQLSTAKITQAIIKEQDLLEIVYTSGTTGEPKGVMLTHKNVISNMEAVKKCVDVLPTQTFLSLLPLSHLFEQNPGFLAPLSLGCTIVYMRGLRPNLIFKTLAQERVTNIVLVPRILKLFADGILREVEAKNKTKLFNKILSLNAPKSVKKVLLRGVHKKFGAHFQYFVVGGAPFTQDLESFWHQLGFTVIQGYGLTECSPVLTANTLQKQVPRSVGRPLQDVQLKFGKDKEVYAKGPNITQGYYLKDKETKLLFEDGWMKTGDIGSINTEGYLFLKGRKKDVIVTSAGVKVYPEDLELILLKNKEIKDVCVLGVPSENGEQVHAEVLLKNKANLPDIIESTNMELNESQQIISYAIFTKEDFPRTTTMKIQKRFVLDEILKRKKTDSTDSHSQSQSKLYQILSRISGINIASIRASSKLSLDLHMTSINRIELISLLEQGFNLDIDEEEITAGTSVERLEKMIQERKGFWEKDIFKRWLLSNIIRAIRATYNLLITDNAMRLFCQRTVIGKDNLENLKEPAIFIANHVGYFDTPSIMMSLPFHIRNKMAVAAWREYFEISKQQIFKRILFSIYYWYASLFTNIFLFPKQKGFKKSLEYTGELLDKGWNILFFPEGKHSESGKLQPFRSGIGWLVKEMKAPVVPIRHYGLENIMAGDAHQIPRFGKITIKIGKPIMVDYTKSIPEITNELHAIIKKM